MSAFRDIADTLINLNVSYMGALGMECMYIYSVNTYHLSSKNIYILHADMLCALRKYFYKLSLVFVLGFCPHCQWGKKVYEEQNFCSTFL